VSASLRDHFRKGAEHWNKFVETYEEELIDFELGTFSTDLNLSGYEFPVPVKFYGCTFKGTVRIEIAEFGSWVTFSEATFEKTLLIKNSTFGGLIDFESAKCKGALVIDECIFKYDARFDDLDVLGRFYISDSKFDGDVSLNELGAYGGLALSKNEFEKEVAFSGQFDREVMFLGNHFKRLVDFKDAFINAPIVLRGNVFDTRPAIDRIHLAYVPILPDDKWHGGDPLIGDYYQFLYLLNKVNRAFANAVARTLSIAKSDESYAALRQFRLFAQEHDDRRLALDIFALEQKNRRLWYDQPLSKGFILGLLFQVFSDFGRSVFRPIVALTIIFVSCSFALFLVGSPNSCPFREQIKSSILLSTNNLLPFLTWQKQSLLSAAELCLFGPTVPMGFGAISIAQSIFSLVFLFLLGLGIRNTLRMQS